ncbi:MAG: phosphate ABC transporter substrate-binding protein [Hyphococcus sp.]|nr:MAG: phosphate ABC transporter substrate-binding protein [Marinicaulis sp.]
MKLNSIAACGFGALLAFGCGEEKAEIKSPIATAEAGDEIRIVGSSTVYPFSTKVAQEFKNKTGYSVVVESTGSGGGHKLFCAGAGADTPDVTNSSRRQKKGEFDTCVKNGVKEIVEVKIGFDGIVLANAIDGAAMDLTLKQIYQAFAKDVPTSDNDCTLQANPYAKWSDIDASLPAATIEAYGPPPTSGTRDAFVEIAMEGGAKKFACLAAMKKDDKSKFKKVAHTLREDGKWIDAGENDNAIVQTLTNTPTAVGVFGYSFLDQNADMVKGALVGGVEPTFENIAGGGYPISRSLFFYLKAGNVDVTDGLKDYALEFTSEEAWGPGGYLEEIGLVPLPDEERAAYRDAVENLNGYSQ